MKKHLFCLLFLISGLSCGTNVQLNPDGELTQESKIHLDSGIEPSSPDEQTPESLYESAQEGPRKEQTSPEPARSQCTKTCVKTIAGQPGKRGYQDGPAKQALLNFPTGITVDKDNNIYFTEAELNLIRKLTPDGQVFTVAGSGKKGSQDGPAKQATFSYPWSLAFADDGNLYISGSDYKIRKLTPNGQVVTVMGTGKPGHKDGPLSTAMLENITIFLTNGLSDDLIISDRELIRRIDLKANTIETIAGKLHTNNWKDGKRSEALFDSADDLTVDPNGNIYIIETHHIRKISKDEVTTIAGQQMSGFKDAFGRSAMFSQPIAIVTDQKGNIYVGERMNQRIRIMTPDGNVTTFAGTGKGGITDGPLLQSEFGAISSMTISKDGHIYVLDATTIRKIDLNCGCHP